MLAKPALPGKIGNQSATGPWLCPHPLSITDRWMAISARSSNRIRSGVPPLRVAPVRTAKPTPVRGTLKRQFETAASNRDAPLEFIERDVHALGGQTPKRPVVALAVDQFLRIAVLDPSVLRSARYGLLGLP